MVDAYVYIVKLPSGINEMVTPSADNSYTIYINEQLCDQKRREAYRHAIKHIESNDFEKTDVQKVEYDSHIKKGG